MLSLTKRPPEKVPERPPGLRGKSGAVGRGRPEWRHQAEIVSRLRKAAKERGWPIDVAASMEAGRRGLVERNRAKVAGMVAGEPDLRIYMPGGRLGLIEDKTKNGVLSKAQKDRHKLLRGLGHWVEVLKAPTPEEAAAEAVEIVAGWLKQLELLPE